MFIRYNKYNPKLELISGMKLHKIQQFSSNFDLIFCKYILKIDLIILCKVSQLFREKTISNLSNQSLILHFSNTSTPVSKYLNVCPNISQSIQTSNVSTSNLSEFIQISIQASEISIQTDWSIHAEREIFFLPEIATDDAVYPRKMAFTYVVESSARAGRRILAPLYPCKRPVCKRQ